MPYTYIVGWKLHKKFYYGARWAKNCSPDDLWKTYFTSSKHVKNFRKLHGEPDLVQVRKIFISADKCKLYERKILTKLNVLNDDKWLNKNINGYYLPNGKQTKQHIENRIKSFKKNRKRNGIIAWKKESHPAYAKKVSDGLLGKSKSPTHVANMRKRIQDTSILTCPHCSKTGDYKNMMRWHMDCCKYNLTRLHDKNAKMVTCFACNYTSKQTPNFFRYHNNRCKSNPRGPENICQKM
jgi:hypothetical protein